VPSFFAVTLPLEETVAMEVSSLDHPDAVAPDKDNVNVDPFSIVTLSLFSAAAETETLTPINPRIRSVHTNKSFKCFLMISLLWYLYVFGKQLHVLIVPTVKAVITINAVNVPDDKIIE
jgi:hypothetical protein